MDDETETQKEIEPPAPAEPVPSAVEGPALPSAEESQPASQPEIPVEIPPLEISQIPPISEPQPQTSQPIPQPQPELPTSSEAGVGTPTASVGASLISSLFLKAKEKIQFRKRQKLEKILALAGLCQSKGKKLTNDDVQKLLRVSDKTATRYLGQLVREGRLKRIGNTGQAVCYEIPS